MSQKRCTPLCKFFRCANRSMKIIHSGNKKIIWCQWAEDPCQGPSCRYAVCIRGQLQKDLTCGMSIQKSQKHMPKKEEKEDVFEEGAILSRAKVKPKSLKKIRDLDYEIL
ncbi:MAG: hypothetical protein ACTSXC_05730 [Candidatus Freyarchaeota archaeon]